ncbi:MAG: response regulator [Cytophagales bacterium]|nr:MAG: response regulator [Cytophagales bacterium]
MGHNLIRKIMLVDDDKINNLINQKMLARYESQLSISVYDAAEDALEAILGDTDQPDLVLLDINMPVMSGWELLDKLIAQNKTNFLVVMLTSSIDSKDVNKTSQYAMVKGYMVKPLNNEKIVDILTRMIVE